MPTTNCGALRASLVALILCLVSAALAPAYAAESAAPAPAPQAAPESLTLDQAIATAIEQNPRVIQSEADLKAARAVVARARAGYSVTADLQITRTHVSEVPTFVLPVPAPPPQLITFETVSLGRSQNTQGTLTVAKPLYTGGKIEAAVRQSRAGERAAGEGVRLTLQSLVSSVKQAYYAVLLAADLVKVAEQADAAAREHLRLAEAHFAAGTAPRFDVLRAEAAVASTEQNVIQGRNGLNLARAALNHAMGVAQDRDFQLTSTYAPPQPEPVPLQTLIGEALKARPEIAQVQAQVDAEGAAADVARANKRPTLGVAWIYNRVINTSALQVTNSTLALQVTQNIFDGRQTSAAVAEARSRQASARALLDEIKQGIGLQVRQAFLSMNSAQERVAAAEKEVAQAEEAYRIAVVRYNAGVSIGVEILDAQAALTAARSDYARAVYDYNVAAAQLELAVGSWQASQIPPPQAAPAPGEPTS
jgi:outer membrane protein